MTYSIVSGNEDGLFWIDTDGSIRVAVSLQDRDNLAASYTIVIKAKDPNSDQYDLATVSIVFTEWAVTRNQQNSAPATSQKGCTVAELADEIGLETGEFQQWLTFTTEYIQLADGTEVHKNNLGANDLLAAGQQFMIPNTIYMAWFGEMRGLGKDWMLWNKNIAQLGQLGFCVETFDNDGGLYRYLPAEEAKAAYLDKMAWLAQNNYLHGLYFMGHGSRRSVGSASPNVFTYGPIWSVDYEEMDAVIDYRLGALIIHACYGNDSNAKSLLLSTKGIYWGVNNVYEPGLKHPVEPIAKLWGQKAKNGKTYWGGEQRTNPFEKY